MKGCSSRRLSSSELKFIYRNANATIENDLRTCGSGISFRKATVPTRPFIVDQIVKIMIMKTPSFIPPVIEPAAPPIAIKQAKRKSV